MKINYGEIVIVAKSDDESVKNNIELVKALYDLLKDTILLSNRSHWYHWNILGTEFLKSHEFFYSEYVETFHSEDPIGEQIRQLGFIVPNIDNPIATFQENDFETQMKAYKLALEQNISILERVNAEATKINHIQTLDLCGELSRQRSLSKYKVESTLNENDNTVEITTASTEIDGALIDKGEYREIQKDTTFFKILKEDCNVRNKHFTSINRGLRLALRIIRENFPDASIKLFAKKGTGGYIRVSIKDKLFIVGYTIYKSDKVKVWTRELKNDVPIKRFDYIDLELRAKPKGAPLTKGMLPVWLSI